MFYQLSHEATQLGAGKNLLGSCGVCGCVTHFKQIYVHSFHFKLTQIHLNAPKKILKPVRGQRTFQGDNDTDVKNRI